MVIELNRSVVKKHNSVFTEQNKSMDNVYINSFNNETEKIQQISSTSVSIVSRTICIFNNMHEIINYPSYLICVILIV